MDIKTQKMLADVVLNAQNKAVKPYTTTATVKSVNNGIVYVEIPGSDRDTPVKNSSVSVKKGDVVDLVVSHSDTHITGNRSDVAVPVSTAQKMSQTLEATRHEMDNELDLFNNKIKMVNNSIEMQDNKIEMQNNTITQFGNTIDQQNNIIEQQNNNITEIGNTVNSQGNDITEIGNKVNSQGNTITEIGNTIELQGSTIETLDSTVQTQGSTIETLDSTVQTQGSTIETLKSTVETQGSTINTLDSTVQTLDSKVQTQGSAIETLDSTVQTQGSTIQTLDSNVKIINSAFVIQDGKLTGLSEIVTNILKSGYVTTDLLNANVAWIENGKIKEGAIGTTEIADASITTAKIDELSADVIKTGTIRTERLILTTDEVDPKTGEKKVALITALNAKVNAGEGNILDGAVIADETITAAKIDVVDLNAFKATIGNFTIGTSSMYNGKTSLKDPTNGVYIGTDGIALGQGSLLGMTDDSPFRVESDGDFHLGAKDGNYINFNAFTGALDINVSSLKIESSNVVERLDNIDKNAIVSQIVEYYPSTSPTSLTGGSWSTSQPTWSEGIYIWSRTKNTNGKGVSSYTTPACITGNTGAQGPQGEQGATTYFHIKYSSVANPTSSSQMTETPSTYIGTYVDFTQTDSSDPSKYTWSRFQGAQGEKGDQGIAGTNGSNGKTSYLHIAYANSSDGTTGFSVSDSTNKLYIGQYTDFTSSDSTDPTKYSWTKIKGDKGNTGATGVGVKSSDVTYQSSTSGTTVPTGTWSSSVPSVSAGSYLWTKTVITYTNNTTTTSYSVGKMGANGTNGTNGTNGKDGADGSDGRGIKSTAVTYQVWSNGTSTPTGTWESSPPATTADKPYLWSKTVLTYTDNTTSTAYSVGSTPEGIEIGGRNLIVGSSTATVNSNWLTNGWGGSFTTYDSYSRTYKLVAYNGWNVAKYKLDSSYAGKTVTLSLKAEKVKSETTAKTSSLGYTNMTGEKPYISGDFETKSTEETETGTLYSLFCTVVLNSDAQIGIGSFCYPEAEGLQAVWLIKDIKLELGNKATDWTPAPEDIKSEIQSVDNKLTTNLFKPTLETTMVNGITCTNNGDGTYTLDGKASAYTSFTFGVSHLKNGKYKLLGAKAFQRDISFNRHQTFDSEDIIEIVDEYPVLEIVYTINEGAKLYTVLVKPMITTNLNAIYDDFVPYTGSTGSLNGDLATNHKLTETVKTIAEQTADKFSWLVKSGTSATNFELTDRVASLLSEKFDIDALTTFKNSAENGTSTVINGGAIDTDSLFAKAITATNMTISGDSKFGNFRANTKIEGLKYINNNFSGLINLGRINDYFDEQPYGILIGYGSSTTHLQAGGIYIESPNVDVGAITKIHGGLISTREISSSSSDLEILFSANLVPVVDGRIALSSLGTSSKKFADLYTSKFNGTSVNSDGIASTSGYGLTKLSTSTSSTSTALAATSSAVKTAYDKAKSAFSGKGLPWAVFSITQDITYQAWSEQAPTLTLRSSYLGDRASTFGHGGAFYIYCPYSGRVEINFNFLINNVSSNGYLYARCYGVRYASDGGNKLLDFTGMGAVTPSGAQASGTLMPEVRGGTHIYIVLYSSVTGKTNASSNTTDYKVRLQYRNIYD